MSRGDNEQVVQMRAMIALIFNQRRLGELHALRDQRRTARKAVGTVRLEASEAQAFAKAASVPILTSIPANEDIRRKSAAYQIVARPGTEWGPLFEKLAVNVAEAPPMRPTPLSQDGLLGLFSSDATGTTSKTTSPCSGSTAPPKS